MVVVVLEELLEELVLLEELLLEELLLEELLDVVPPLQVPRLIQEASLPGTVLVYQLA